jgi:hypothetical protein
MNGRHGTTISNDDTIKETRVSVAVVPPPLQTTSVRMLIANKTGSSKMSEILESTVSTTKGCRRVAALHVFLSESGVSLLGCAETATCVAVDGTGNVSGSVASSF